MLYREKQGDLFFTVPDDYLFAQCISADLSKGDGIALEFNNVFKTMDELICKYVNLVDRWDSGARGMCIRQGNVLNLVTKRRSCDKPTLLTMTTALLAMRDICITQKVKKVAMPKIGCGYDGLSWDDVSKRIKKVFADTDVEILVCCVKENNEGGWRYEKR